MYIVTEQTTKVVRELYLLYTFITSKSDLESLFIGSDMYVISLNWTVLILLVNENSNMILQVCYFQRSCDVMLYVF